MSLFSNNFNLEVAATIDHTILKPETSEAAVQKLIDEALHYHFAAVCIPPTFCNFARPLLKNSDVNLATVIGFPFGYQSTAAKVAEIYEAKNNGANELDVVVFIGAVKEHKWSKVNDDLKAMREASSGTVLKVIIESGMLDSYEMAKICEICANLQVDYVKTSTGFNGSGASIEAIKFMRSNLPESIKLKASGGIRTAKFAKELIAAGANRLGCSAGVKLVQLQELENESPNNDY